MTNEPITLDTNGILSEIIVAIGYDVQQKGSFVLINPTQWLYNPQLRKLTLQQQAEFLTALANTAGRFLEGS